MAISRHNGSYASNTYKYQCNSCTSLTQAFDVGTDANRVLLVGANQDNAQISGITFNAVALTQLAHRSDSAGICDIWGLNDPDTGSHNVVFTSGVGGTYIDINIVSYDGADITQNANSATSASATSASVAITCSNNNYVVCFITTSKVAITAGQGTELANFTSADTTSQQLGMNDILVSGGTPQTMSWSWTGNKAYDIVGIEVTAAAGGGGGAVTPTNNFLLMGI